MSLSDHIRRACTSAALLFVAIGSVSSAHAEWESIYTVRADRDNCDKPQETGSAIIRAREHRELRVQPGADVELEAYGHGLDLVPDISLSSIADGSARRTGGNGGAVNGAHRCGNIGSVKFQFRVGANAVVGDTGTLNIGGERISVRVVDTPFLTEWSVYNVSEALSAETQAEIEVRRARLNADVAASAPQRALDCQTGIAACQIRQDDARREREARQAACASSGQSCNGFIVLQSCSQIVTACRAPGLARPDLKLEGPARCLRDFGGNVTIDNAGVLVIEIPLETRTNRTAFEACMRKGFPITVGNGASNADITPFTGHVFGTSPLGDPKFRTTRSTGAFPMSANNSSDTLFGLLSSRVLTEAVGSTSGELLLARNTLDSQLSHFRNAASSLKWRVEVTPGNGIASVSPQMVTNRKSGTLNVSFTMSKPVVAATSGTKSASSFSLSRTTKVQPTAFWDVVAEGSKTPATCFGETGGELRLSTGQSSGSFDLKPTEVSGCSTSRFRVRVWVSGANAIAGQPFQRDASFAPGSPLTLAAPKTSVQFPIKGN